MKNNSTQIFLLVLGLFAMCNLTYGQVTFGLKTGVNIATTKGLLAFPKNRLGFYAGGSVSTPVYKKLFFQPEILFSVKGYRAEDFSDGKMSAMRLNYLNIPLLIGYQIDSKTKMVLGPELGYLLDATNYSRGGNFEVSNNFPKKVDVGIAIGLGYNFTKSVAAEIRYVYGLNGFYLTDFAGTSR